MRIERLWIQRFRGISALDWRPSPGLNCIIGPGDGAKTTILDAIDCLLAERHTIAFDDLDFYNGDTSQNIFIGAIVSGLRNDLLRDDRYGHALSGWNTVTGEWHEEPAEQAGVVPAIFLALEVDCTLEPAWYIWVQRNKEVDKTKRLAFVDRKLISPARLGVYADKHLSWARGSSLQRIGSHPEQLPATLNGLLRSARDSFAAQSASAFSEIVDAISPDIAKLGVQVQGTLSANLDHTSFSMNASGVSLHDGNIPLRCMGTGSSRLAVAALQSTESASRNFLLVDELEYGLEPHRISLLVSHLRQRVVTSGQAFITTHSPTVLREVRFDEVHVCRRDAKTGRVGVVTAGSTSTATLDARRYVRDKGEALLGRTVLVCEGQTEVALLKGFAESTQFNFQADGVALVDGGGHPNLFAVALHFARMGYRTAVLADSDRPTDPKTSMELSVNRVAHFAWDIPRCTEQELFCGLPDGLASELLTTIANNVGHPQVLGELSSHLKVRFNSLAEVTPYLTDATALMKMGAVANSAKWIKNNFDLCFQIGSAILGIAPLLGDSSLVRHLEALKGWMASNA
ncbi:ATP-dependent nuclease [Cupriavidus sp. D39]|uniref:ATP-dependent nuclease n=1 Tax=Cupriavidus sp. D39 TaxID=2997877 RepID=UPI00226EC29A|nr:AAA family ATPase [Cupriavidus sp. D39]MCY0857546.1 AAA family ATPase [Cupriavidus sp. D39]